MPDLPPQKLTGDERETLCSLLQFQRESLLRNLDGLDDEQARWSPVPSGTSLWWLADHASFAERIWLLDRFDGQGEAGWAMCGDPARPVAAVVELYRQTWAEVDAVVAAAELDDLCALPPADAQVNLRWILGHLLEEIARHAGHADILRELLDGTTGR